jgi:hypothetical protein
LRNFADFVEKKLMELQAYGFALIVAAAICFAYK